MLVGHEGLEPSTCRLRVVAAATCTCTYVGLGSLAGLSRPVPVRAQRVSGRVRCLFRCQPRPIGGRLPRKRSAEPPEARGPEKSCRPPMPSRCATRPVAGRCSVPPARNPAHGKNSASNGKTPPDRLLQEWRKRFCPLPPRKPLPAGLYYEALRVKESPSSGRSVSMHTATQHFGW